jgi:hypothetical protein
MSPKLIVDAVIPGALAVFPVVAAPVVGPELDGPAEPDFEDDPQAVATSASTATTAAKQIGP